MYVVTPSIKGFLIRILKMFLFPFLIEPFQKYHLKTNICHLSYRCKPRELTGPTRAFDGIMLCLPDKLAQDQMTVEAVHSVDNSIVDVTITLKHRKTMADRSTTQFYNILFRKIMKTLKMVEMNRNFYNPVSAMMVPQHKLEIWPGYVTAVHEYEGGVMLCLDISHKVSI